MAKQNTAQPRSPDEELAEQVVCDLAKLKLVPSQKIEEIQSKIARGAATSEDWKLWVDVAMGKEAQQ